ncbi:MAG: cyclic nucleotide-binding domain-containing protein [Spirochaetia bacterium]
MSFRLKEAVFKVRCRAPGCPFFPEIVVKENIMGATEADVDSEAMKIARNMAYIKHDALYGRTHALENPEATKVTGSYEHIGPAPALPTPAAAPSVPTRTYRPGEIIIRKGESAVRVCEIINGSALNEHLPDLIYKPGSFFGAAAIFRNKSRMTDIVAGPEGATVAFFNIRELSKTNPAKARELYDEAMEDIFHVVQHLEDYSRSLEKQVKKLETALAAKKPAVKKAPAKKAPVKKAPVKKAAKKAAKKPAKKPAAKPKKAAAKKKPKR